MIIMEGITRVKKIKDKKMKYALKNIETGDIVKTYASMREFLNDFPKGLDEDNRKTFRIINL